MQREILQEKSLSRKRGNAEKTINVDLSGKAKLIPYSSAADMLSLNDLYLEERNACENYRMIFTVNPVCTNVIYNSVTEPVYKEGSESAFTLVETNVARNGSSTPSFSNIFPEGTINQSGDVIDQVFAVRDTEISHERLGNFKYHCGFDIFNNHLLRSLEFEHVQLETYDDKNNPKNKIEFNTIFDFAVDFSGRTVVGPADDSVGPENVIVNGKIQLRQMDIRLYSLDTIRTMNAALYNELRAVDGWYGFYNSGYINIPNAVLDNKEISLNNILNNETPCGFIDLYPDRSLYSFIPKVNRYRKRIERNWDCAIAYPYANDYDMFNLLNCGEISGETCMGAVRVLNTEVVYNNVGDELIQMHSLLRHTLNPGDEIRILYTATGGDNGVVSARYIYPVTVVSTGDKDGNDEKHYFTIKAFDVSSFAKVYEEIDSDTEMIVRQVGYHDSAFVETQETKEEFKPITFYYRKIENGYDDKYYFRKFKVFKDYEYVSVGASLPDATATALTLTKAPAVVTENSPEYIKFEDEYFKLTSRPLTYTQNKIAYGENIYGDRIAQVIFNDDICTSGIRDNLGRPLSTVYFVAIKTNRGHKEWYEEGNASASTVEFSHCFGEVTSGLDMPVDEGSTEYNVRKLYNVFKEDCPEKYAEGLELILSDCPTGEYSGTPTPLESGITLDDFDEFYGDIVEFSKAKFLETTIEKVYHRFNTAQRECLKNPKYFDINYDELVGDLYDVGENG